MELKLDNRQHTSPVYRWIMCARTCMSMHGMAKLLGSVRHFVHACMMRATQVPQSHEHMVDMVACQSTSGCRWELPGWPCLSVWCVGVVCM
jgi:hypothetical protein